jgi:DNA invertase Pin-like site-specific DNA recombinase
MCVTSAVVYTRTATEPEHPDLQREACEELCAAHHLSVLDVVSEVASGIRLDRPGLHRVMDYARTHKVGAVVVYRPDRLSRNLRQLQAILEAFKSYGVSLYFVKGGQLV